MNATFTDKRFPYLKICSDGTCNYTLWVKGMIPGKRSENGWSFIYSFTKDLRAGANCGDLERWGAAAWIAKKYFNCIYTGESFN